jgi:prevent-host-death family protein
MKSQNFVGLTWLKMANAERLRELDEPVLVCCHSQPVAAVVPYELYLKWQEQLKKIEGLQN